MSQDAVRLQDSHHRRRPSLRRFLDEQVLLDLIKALASCFKLALLSAFYYIAEIHSTDLFFFALIVSDQLGVVETLVYRRNASKVETLLAFSFTKLLALIFCPCLVSLIFINT